MSSALLLAKDNISSFKLEELLKTNSLRVKFTFDRDLIKEWLELMSFDLFLMPLDEGFEKQDIYTTALWRRNPQASFVLYDLDKKSQFDETRQRVFGAEVVYGEKAIPHLQRLLDKIGAKKALNKNQFKVLVVEDLDSPRDIICSYIEALGYTKVKGVASAAEAISQLKADPRSYDCIITDERMPEMTGHELIEYARDNKETAQIPIIVLTAHGTQDCLSNCLRAGATGFLVKPPKKDDLIRELARATRVASGLENARMISQGNIDQIMDIIQRRAGF